MSGKRPRVTTVVGARPQFVKLGALSPRLRRVANERILHTGQHYDYEMSRLFFEELRIPEPDVHLGVGSGSHAEQIGRTMIAVEEDLLTARPDLVIVFGDTNTTLGAALAASKLDVPIAHVEAGVRGYDRSEPEETNRVLTDRLSALCLVPTVRAVDNLAREGITIGVHRVGDVMADALLDSRRLHGDGTDRVAALGLRAGAYALATFHRPANVDRRETLSSIVSALARVGRPVFLPLHPRTRTRLEGFGLLDELRSIDGVTLSTPVGYLTMLALLANAGILLTDSGGLQKEAYLLEVPCVTVSRQTAWVETVASGWNRLVLPEEDAIVHAARDFSGGRTHEDHYGDGHAADRIAEIVAR